MEQTSAPPGRMGYSRARAMLLIVGLLVLGLLTLYLYIRSVDPVEMGGTLLFVPVFIAFVFWNEKGGIIAGILAGAGYAALRYGDVQAFGTSEFSTLIASRAVAYIAFGFIGGWANRQLEGSLNKLELYDQIDDGTGLFNARFFLQDTDLEMSRATRYQTLFSVASVNIPVSATSSMSKRQRDGVLKDFGRLLKQSVRTVDRAAHGVDREYHRLAVVLPETAKEGGEIFTSRLADKLAEYLSGKGVKVERSQITHQSITFPGEEDALAQLRSIFTEIAKSEHPDVSEAASGNSQSR